MSERARPWQYGYPRATLSNGSAMALLQLTDEQIRDWTREQKDRWWLENVFRGDMPQLTLRSALTGFLLGGVLSATNLYVGAKTGWTLGVGLTCVILAFAMFKILSRLGVRDMTILENNAMQSIATAAGYMTGPLISGMAAYMWVENRPLPWWQMACVQRRAVDPRRAGRVSDEAALHQRRAAAVPRGPRLRRRARHAVHRRAPRSGCSRPGARDRPPRSPGFDQLHLRRERTCALIQEKWLGLNERLAPAAQPRRAGTTSWRRRAWCRAAGSPASICASSALSPALDLAMFGAGGLMGIRTAASLLLGMVLNFVVIVPWMISTGEIVPRVGLAGSGHGGLRARPHPQHLVAVVGHRDHGRRVAGRAVRASPRSSCRRSGR